ncbi:MAG: mannose-6-phosphate isomerase, class I, partial [bacterium]
MKTIELLHNPIQEYAWGSVTAIPDFLGKRPSQKPQAEMWMGAHPKSPSYVSFQGRQRSLIELLERFPSEILGRLQAEKYSNQLPFLFKVLAAEKPLSIQAHPSTRQAEEGFNLENSHGLALDAVNRNYRDRNHKPEIICALAPFWALNGFRRLSEILDSLEALHPASLEDEISRLKRHHDRSGLGEFFSSLLSKSKAQTCQIVREVLDASQTNSAHHEQAYWMKRLQTNFPDDIGVISPVLLNLVKLNPGEAMYLPAGALHAYLHGMGIELMANSDNVLRGGLTPKHVDVRELLKVLTFQPGQVEILSPVEITPGEREYRTPAREFRLSVIQVTARHPFLSARNRGVEILICSEGRSEIETLANGGMVGLRRGQSVLVPA